MNLQKQECWGTWPLFFLQHKALVHNARPFSLMQAQVHEKADAAAQECTCLAPRCCCCCCCTNWLMALRCALCTKYVLAVIGALSTGACTDKLRNARIFSAAHPAHTKKLPLVWGSFSKIYFPARFPTAMNVQRQVGSKMFQRKSEKISPKVIKSPKQWKSLQKFQKKNTEASGLGNLTS